MSGFIEIRLSGDLVDVTVVLDALVKSTVFETIPSERAYVDRGRRGVRTCARLRHRGGEGGRDAE